VDLSNREIENTGFLKFYEQVGFGDSLIKNASYLLHSDDFSKIRNALLSQSASIVQDDSGIPLRFFDPANWQITLFGHYRRPTGVFKGFYQPEVDALARSGQSKPIDFAIGYFWWIDGAGLQVAINKGIQFHGLPRGAEN
jgi:hypothetical protein